MNDKQRIKLLAGLIENCPTASFHFNDDDAIEEAGGPPVGFTIRVEGVCDPISVTGSSFRAAVDKLARAMKKDGKYESVTDRPQGPFASFP